MLEFSFEMGQEKSGHSGHFSAHRWRTAGFPASTGAGPAVTALLSRGRDDSHMT